MWQIRHGQRCSGGVGDVMVGGAMADRMWIARIGWSRLWLACLRQLRLAVAGYVVL